MLSEMLSLARSDPHRALGVLPGVDAAGARMGFMERTKRFHPSKFARFGPETSRLANEVFLALRTAHETVTKLSAPAASRTGTGPQPGAVAVSRTATSTQPGAVIGARAATTPGAPAPTPAPRSAGTSNPPTPAPQPIGPSNPPTPTRMPAVTPSQGERQTSSSAGIPIPGAATARPAQTTPRSTPVAVVGGTRRTASFPAVAPPTEPPPATGPRAAMAGQVDMSRPRSPSIPPRPITGSMPAQVPPGMSPRSHTATAPVVRPQSTTGSQPVSVGARAASTSGSMPSVRFGGTTKPPPFTETATEEDAFGAALGSLRKRNWTEAKHAFHALAVRVPTDKRYRAYLAVARGREAQDAGNHDEARAEFGRALALEPELDAARVALEQLGEPAKKPQGGFFSRLLKK